VARWYAGRAAHDRGTTRRAFDGELKILIGIEHQQRWMMPNIRAKNGSTTMAKSAAPPPHSPANMRPTPHPSLIQAWRVIGVANALAIETAKKAAHRCMDGNQHIIAGRVVPSRLSSPCWQSALGACNGTGHDQSVAAGIDAIIILGGRRHRDSGAK